MDLIENASIVESSNRHPWELARYSIIKNNVNKIQRKRNTNLQVVDIGCGDAYVINRLQSELLLSGAVGVDINFSDDHLFRLSSDEKGVTFFRNFSEIVVSEEGNYLILLNDVLEHIEEDFDFFASVLSHFSQAKSVDFYITVPAFQFIFSQHDVDLLHFRRYTLRSLGAIAERNKLEISEKGYFFLGLFSIRVLQFLLERLTKGGNADRNSIGVNHWRWGRLVTSAITSLLYIDYLILRSFSRFGIQLPGLSAWSIFTYNKR